MCWAWKAAISQCITRGDEKQPVNCYLWVGPCNASEGMKQSETGHSWNDVSAQELKQKQLYGQKVRGEKIHTNQ